jgi:hypothetical protein
LTGEPFNQVGHRPVVSGECKAAGGERQCTSVRLVNSGSVFIFGKELAYIFSSAYHNDNGGAGDAHKEQDLKKSHGKDHQSHRD